MQNLTKNQVSLKLLPIGILGLSVFAIDLYLSLSSIAIQAPSTPYGISALMDMDGTWRVFADLFFLGFAGGVYIVPMYAFMQAYAPVSHRSRVVGANNIFNTIFMVGSAVFSIIILTMLKLSLPQLFLITGVLNAIFGIFLYKKLKNTKTP